MLLFLQALRRGYATALGAEVVKVCVWKGRGDKKIGRLCVILFLVVALVS